jgi:hypothetical protein
MVTEKFFQDLDVEGVNCELVGRDLVDGQPYHMVLVRGLTTAWAMKNKLTSGVTTLFSENAKINDGTNQLIFPPGDVIKVRTITLAPNFLKRSFTFEITTDSFSNQFNS